MQNENLQWHNADIRHSSKLKDLVLLIENIQTANQNKKQKRKGGEGNGKWKGNSFTSESFYCRE